MNILRINGKRAAVYRVVTTRDVESIETKTWRATTELWLGESKLVVAQDGLTGEFGKADNITAHSLLQLKSAKPLGRQTGSGIAVCRNGKSYRVRCQLRPLKTFELELVAEAKHKVEMLAAYRAVARSLREAGEKRPLAKTPGCPVCGWGHDEGFNEIVLPDHGSIQLAGVLPEIVQRVHDAHERGFAGLSTKNEALLNACRGYRHPCKAFDDLKRRREYKLLFDTSRRGFISLRGTIGKNRKKSEPRSE